MNKRIRLFEEIITAVLLLVTLFPLVHYGELAGIPVPRHFFHGEIDAWGDRTVFLYLALIAAALYGLLFFVQKHPRLINLPRQTGEGNPALATAIGRAIKMWGIAVFAWLSLSLYLMAVGKLAQPLSGVTWTLLAAMALHLLYLIFRQRKV